MPGPIDFFQRMADEAAASKAAEAGMTVEDYQARAQADYEAQEQAALARRQAERNQQLVAETEFRKHYGQRLGLPAPAHAGHIIRLAGLSARSSGSGKVRGTVYHVVLDGPLKVGRLNRQAGDLLCRAAATVGRCRSLDITGTGSWNRDDVLDTSWHDVEINCAACRKTLERLAKTSAPPSK